MYSVNISNFDLEQIALSGQCFRMNRIQQAPISDSTLSAGFTVSTPDDTVCYSVISTTHYLEISQKGNLFTFNCPKEDLTFWYHYFDLETDYGAFLSSIDPKDTYLMEAGKAGNGIRILRQDLWEMILTFILSQQKTIPKIKEGVELLSQKYGTKMQTQTGTVYYTFPTPDQLISATQQELLDLKFGYRAKYIERIAKDARTGLLDLTSLCSMPYSDAFSYLMQFYGIGEKVANCICLFGLHHIDAFPVDTWIQKILLREYWDSKYSSLPKSRLLSQIIQDSFGRYKGYAGVMQQYIFFFERLYKS